MATVAACGGSGGDGATTSGSGCLVSSVSIGPETLTVTVGETRDLFAAFSGVNCTLAQTVTWSNGNTSALSLQADGNTAHVTGRAVNAQPVAVTASIGGKSATSQVMVRPPPTIKLTPETLTFTAARNGPSPQSQAVSITNAGGGTLNGLAAGNPVYGAGASGWLLVQSLFLNPTAPASLNLVPTNTTLAAGTYTATVPITSPVATNSPQNITVVFTITGSAAAPSISNLSASLTGLNGCTHSDGSKGNAYTIQFSYTDPSGGQFAGTVFQTVLFNPSAVAGSASIPVPSSGVTVSNGTIAFGNCLTFGTDASMSYTITLQNSSGQSSNTLNGTITKPAGGASAGPGRLSTFGIGSPGR